MKTPHKLVVFSLDEQKFALHLDQVERIIPGLEIHPLPLAPPYVMGTVNFQGELLPVINLRTVFLLPRKELELSHRFIVSTTPEMKVAFWVDAVNEIVELSREEVSASGKILLDSCLVESLFTLRDDLVLIHDIDKLLTAEEITKLETALRNQRKTKDEGRRTRGEGRK